MGKAGHQRMEVGNQDVGVDRPIKALVADACQELHLVPDLAMHLAICDRISQNPYGHGEEAVKAIYKELDSRKPVVQYLALKLLETCMKNSGPEFYRLVAQKKMMKLMEEHANGKKNSGFLSKFGSDDLDTQRKKEEVKELACVLVKGWAEAFIEIKDDVPLFMDTYLKLQRDGVKFPQLIEEDRNYFTPPPVIPEDNSTHQPAVQAVMGQAVGAPHTSPAPSGMPNLSEAIEQAKLLKEVLQTVEPGAEIAGMDFVVELADAVKRAQSGIQANAEAVNDEATLMAVIAAVDHIDQALNTLAELEACAPGAASASNAQTVSAVEQQLNQHDVQVQLDAHDAQHPSAAAPAPASFIDHADMLIGQEPAPSPEEADLMDLLDISVPTTAPSVTAPNNSEPAAVMPQQQQPDLDLLGMPTQPNNPAPTPPKKGLLPPPPSSKPRRKTPPKSKPAAAQPAELQRQDSFEAFFGGELQPEPAPAYSNQTQQPGIQSHKPAVQMPPPPPLMDDSALEDYSMTGQNPDSPVVSPTEDDHRSLLR